MYSVKEMFYSLQGEGAHTGRTALFCRFTGCNLWSGREQDRSKAECQFCDTDFIGTDGDNGGRFETAELLGARLQELWQAWDKGGKPYVIFTGGEPALQLDEALIEVCHQLGFEVAIETNGTKPLPEGIDWICVSPKAGSEIIITRGDELKLVYPQPLAMPERFVNLDFTHWFLQPMDGPMRELYTRDTINYCLQHPQWRLSLQTHKLTGIQ